MRFDQKKEKPAACSCSMIAGDSGRNCEKETPPLRGKIQPADRQRKGVFIARGGGKAFFLIWER